MLSSAWIFIFCLLELIRAGWFYYLCWDVVCTVDSKGGTADGYVVPSMSDERPVGAKLVFILVSRMEEAAKLSQFLNVVDLFSDAGQTLSISSDDVSLDDSTSSVGSSSSMLVASASFSIRFASAPSPLSARSCIICLIFFALRTSGDMRG